MQPYPNWVGSLSFSTPNHECIAEAGARKRRLHRAHADPAATGQRSLQRPVAGSAAVAAVTPRAGHVWRWPAHSHRRRAERSDSSAMLGLNQVHPPRRKKQCRCYCSQSCCHACLLPCLLAVLSAPFSARIKSLSRLTGTLRVALACGARRLLSQLALFIASRLTLVRMPLSPLRLLTVIFGFPFPPPPFIDYLALSTPVSALDFSILGLVWFSLSHWVVSSFCCSFSFHLSFFLGSDLTRCLNSSPFPFDSIYMSSSFPDRAMKRF